ncbi:MAG: right-handed parallel beta-helix repeat-containing protein [Candidatus Symbiothrix sp.]|jgi:hypothetical protein|nr:right-handed parallel beta-helix repeat-containing protein [Candidatus Symbiothrix sp.]
MKKLGLFLVMVLAGWQIGYGQSTVQQVLNDLNNRIGTPIDEDGHYGCQCVDLIKYVCRTHFNVVTSGNAIDYKNFPFPQGWQKIQYTQGFIPMPGDIFITDGPGPKGHIGIIETANEHSYTSFETNGGEGTPCAGCSDHTEKGTTLQTYPRASYTSLGGFWGVIRPPYSSSFNDGVAIYAGKADTPKTNVKIYLDADGINSNFNANKITSIKINGNEKLDGKVSSGIDPIKVKDAYISGNKAYITLDFCAVSTNKEYNLSIDIRDNNNDIKTYYGNSQLYYIDENDIMDIIPNSWYEPYVKSGIKNGLFKGSYGLHEGYNRSGYGYAFNPEGYLTRGQFAKVVVCAAINSGENIAINTSTANGSFSDVPLSNEFFPYIQTLRNYGFIASNTNFNWNSNITAGEISKIIVNVFGLAYCSNSDNYNHYGSKIRIESSVAGDILAALQKLTTIIDWRENEFGKPYRFEILCSGFLPITTYDLTRNEIIVRGDNYVKRAMMAKVLDNVCSFKIKYNNSAQNAPMRATQSTNNSTSNITIIGDKFEATDNVTGEPFTVGNLGNITLIPGQQYTFDKFKNITGDIFFYWSVNGGTLEDLAPNKAHNMVRFTAPENITSTQVYNLYMYAGTSTGRYIEALGTITVNVNGSPNLTHLDAPTGLYIGGTGQNYFKVYWDYADWDNVTKYIVQSATNSAFTQNVQEDIKTGGEANRSISRDPGKYYIRIKAVNTALNLESAWSNTLTYTFAPNIPFDIWNDQCTPTDGAVLSGNSVTFTWYATGSNNPTFDLHFADWNPFGQAPVISNTTATIYTINNLNWNTTYYWGVKGRDAGGVEDHTNVMSFTTARSTNAPTGSITINNGASSVNTPLVNLQFTAQTTGGTIQKMKLSNDGVNWTDWLWYSTHYVWKLQEYGGTTNPGQKTVYVKFKDNSENESPVYTDNITLEQGVLGYFIVRDKQFVSLREAIEYAVAGDNIYATAGYFDLTDEIGTLTTTTVGGNKYGGAVLKNGVNLIGEGMGKTTLYWNMFDENIDYSSGCSLRYGLTLDGNNIIDGLTLITADGCGCPVRMGKVSNCTIQNCELKNSKWALHIPYYGDMVATNITIQNCLIHDNDQHTINIENCNNLKIHNNSIYNNGGATLGCGYMLGNNVSIKNNIVANNGGQAIYIYKEGALNFSFTNNNVWNNHYTTQEVSNYDEYQTGFLHDQTGINGNISVNPQLDNNQKLLSGSPCINAGVNVGLPYAGSAPDMGAFETGLSVGSLTVNSNVSANFVISKPDGSSATVASGQTISNLAQGIYGVYPQQVAGYNLPNPQIITLTQGASTLQINYTADTQAPEGRLYLNAGDFFTHSRYISIYNDITDKVNGLGSGAKMQFSNNGATWSPQEPLANKKLLWDLASYGGNLNEGNKVIYAKFCDAGGNWSDVITDTIQYIPNGRIKAINESNYHRDSIRYAQDGDIILLAEGQYAFRDDISAKIKIQGVNKNAAINNAYIRFNKETSIDNVSFASNASLFVIDYNCSMFNLYFDNIYSVLVRNAHLNLANSILTSSSTSEYSLVQIQSRTATTTSYNNLFVGAGNIELPISNSRGINIYAHEDVSKKSQISNNIFKDFSSENYVGAIWTRKSGSTNNNGDIFIANNDFYNCRKDVDNDLAIIENTHPYNIVPDFLSDGSYKLQANSPLRYLGSDNIIHNNHDGSKNTLGIEGGLFYNTVPTAQAEIKQQGGKVILDASASYDAQTPAEFLQ